MTPNDVESIFMHGWIVQLDQVRARIAAEREILIKGVGYLARRWCWISRAAERAGRAAMAIGSQSLGQPELSKVLRHALKRGGRKHHGLLEF